MVNSHIVVATVFITGVGAFNHLISGKPLTPVLIGGVMFMLVLSLADLAGGAVSTFASALAMLAVLYILLTQFPWSIVLTIAEGKPVKQP